MPSTTRTVPERERMTIDSVVAALRVKRTPLRMSPSVTPVAAKKQLSPPTRSSRRQHAVGVDAGRDHALALVVVARPQPAQQARRRCS